MTTPLDREFNSLHGKFERLAEELELSDWYEPIDYNDLTLEQQQKIDALNLVELFRDELTSEGEPDLPIIKFILRRLGQLGDDSVLEDVFNNIEYLYPVFPDIINYLRSLRYLEPGHKHSIGQRVIQLLEDSIVSELTYHRMWILDLFTHSQEWDNESRFFSMYASEPDQHVKRKLILAMGRAGQRHWFQSQWRSLFDHPHWPRRALLAGASCMPPDARKHWYRSVESRLDELEVAVMKWARQYPFAQS